jgi:hypothetical protein
MKSVDDLLAKLPDHAVPFFVFFSRFEYALKRGGFLKTPREQKCRKKIDDSASPNWDSFASVLGQKFLDEVRDSAKAETILTTPPKKQVVVKGNDLDWRDGSSIRTAADLFVAVRRLRNNLFHGGKFPNSSLPVGNPDRDDRLISEAIEILKMALARCQSVKTKFFES